MARGKQAKSIVTSILEGLLDLSETIFECSISRRAAYYYLNRMPGDPKPSRQSFSRQLNGLKRSGYIQLHSDSIILTNKAKMKIVDKLVEKYPKDNKYYLISFDIPEQFRISRNKFRRFIKRLGFVQIQKSLWATNRDIGDLVEMASQELNVESYIAYFVSVKSNIDGLIKNKLVL